MQAMLHYNSYPVVTMHGNTEDKINVCLHIHSFEQNTKKEGQVHTCTEKCLHKFRLVPDYIVSTY